MAVSREVVNELRILQISDGTGLKWLDTSLVAYSTYTIIYPNGSKHRFI